MRIGVAYVQFQFQQQTALFFMGLPPIAAAQTEAVLGPSVGWSKISPGVELRFAKKKNSPFQETVAGPTNFADHFGTALPTTSILLSQVRWLETIKIRFDTRITNGF